MKKKRVWIVIILWIHCLQKARKHIEDMVKKEGVKFSRTIFKSFLFHLTEDFQ